MLNSVTAKSNFRIHFERRAKISWVPNSKSYQNCSILLGYFLSSPLWDTLQASASLDLLLNAKSRLQTGALQTEGTTSYEMLLNHRIIHHHQTSCDSIHQIQVLYAILLTVSRISNSPMIELHIVSYTQAATRKQPAGGMTLRQWMNALKNIKILVLRCLQ